METQKAYSAAGAVQHISQVFFSIFLNFWARAFGARQFFYFFPIFLWGAPAARPIFLPLPFIFAWGAPAAGYFFLFFPGRTKRRKSGGAFSGAHATGGGCQADLDLSRSYLDI